MACHVGRTLRITHFLFVDYDNDILAVLYLHPENCFEFLYFLSFDNQILVTGVKLLTRPPKKVPKTVSG